MLDEVTVLGYRILKYKIRHKVEHNSAKINFDLKNQNNFELNFLARKTFLIKFKGTIYFEAKVMINFNF